MDIRLITKAAAFAAEAHALQTRKELNEAYITHPLRVGELAAQFDTSGDLIAAAYLHDVVEDTPLELSDLAIFPLRVQVLVRLLTKPLDPAQKTEYYTRIAQNPLACTLKLLDRVDNIRDMIRVADRSPNMRSWASRYLAKTINEFGPVIKGCYTAEVIDLFEKTVADLATKLSVS